MPKEVLEITDFNQGTVTTPSERDISPETAAYSLNIDPLTEDGKLIGVPQDRIVNSISGNVSFETLNYGLQWGASAIRVANLNLVPVASTEGNGSRIIFQGSRGINEILKYTSSYFDTSQIKDSLLNISAGVGDSTGEFNYNTTELIIIDFALKREGLMQAGDIIALSSETSVVNIPSNIEWMLVESVNQPANTITVQRGYYNTTPVNYTSLSTNTNIYKLTGVLGWLNVTGWQENFQSNHIGQNPCIVYVANAGTSSAFNLTHDSTNKTITITSGALVNNLGTADALEDLIKNNDVIKIINASGGVAIVKIDYMADGVINYSSISGSLSTQTSGEYWIDANKIANGNFRANGGTPKTPYGWTTTINPAGTATYDDVYADDTKSIGSPQLVTSGGITGLKGNERDTSNSTYDMTAAGGQPATNSPAESAFLVLSNARDTSIADITLTDAIAKDSNEITFRVSNTSLVTTADTLVLSHGVGITFDNGSGDNAFLGTDDNPYLGNSFSPGYMYEAISTAGFTDDDVFTINVPTSIDGSGEDIIMRLEDTSSASLSSAGANNYINVSNEDNAGANASDTQCAINVADAINGCADPQRVTYGTNTGIGDTVSGIAGLHAVVNAETSTKVDIWGEVAEEYVKVKSIEVCIDSEGDNHSGFITVDRAYHGNLQAHSAGTSIKRILRTQIKQTVGADGFEAVKQGKKYKLTWWAADVTKAILGNNDYSLNPRLNFKVGVSGGFMLSSTLWSSDKTICGASGENAWLNSSNFTAAVDGNRNAFENFKGSLDVTLNGQVDILGDASAKYVKASIDNNKQVDLNAVPRLGDTISVVQASGTAYNGNWTVGDATDINYLSSSSEYSAVTAPTALIHLSGTIHDKSIIGIPGANTMFYYTALEGALAGESVVAVDGSAPKRRFYIEFEEYVGLNGDAGYGDNKLKIASGAIKFDISAADGTFCHIKTSPYASPLTGLSDMRYDTYGTLITNASQKNDNANQNSWWLVPTDGVDVGYLKTYPTSTPFDGSGTQWNGNSSDDNTGAVLNTGVAWAKSLKACIEAALPNKFTITRSGAALCIEDNVGGVIAETVGNPSSNGTDLDLSSTSNITPPYFSNNYANGYMNFHITAASTYLDDIGSYLRWENEDNASGGDGHQGFLKGDGLGMNLGSIISGGGYASEGSDVNWIPYFTTCYSIGDTPNAAEGATNLDLAIENVLGQNGAITGAVANTDELTLTRVDGTLGFNGGVIDNIRFPDRLTSDSDSAFAFTTTEIAAFEFLSTTTDDYNGAAKVILWHKCEFEFILPEDKDISSLDIYFESDGEVWGTRNAGTIGSGVVDKYSSLIGIDSVSLVESVEILPFEEGTTEITASSSMKDSEGKEILLYHNKSDSSLNVIDDFGDPLDGHTNTLNTEVSFIDAVVNKYPSFTKNNREFHIGMGPDNESLWAGFLNHKQFGNDLTNKFIIDKSIIDSYDSAGGASLDKIAECGEWHLPIGSGASFSGSNIILDIPNTEHSLAVGDYVDVRFVFNSRGHINIGTHNNFDSNGGVSDSDMYDPTCMFMHPVSSEIQSGGQYGNNTTGPSIYTEWEPTGAGVKSGSKIISITNTSITVELSFSTEGVLDNSRFAARVRPSYFYGIQRGTDTLYRISTRDGNITKGTLPFRAQSICACHSQSGDDVGGTGSRFLGGRVWIADKDNDQVHRVKVALSNLENINKEKTINPIWCTWWSGTDGSDVVVKDHPPTDRGHISDIIETWGLKGDTSSLDNESDTRLWIQFYPNSGSAFGPLDNFIYCGNTDSLSELAQIVNVNFCNRTIPLNHTGGGTQALFDPHNRYGKTMNEVISENSSNVGTANEPYSQLGRIIAKHKVNIDNTMNRWSWYNPHFINHYWNMGFTPEFSEQIHQKTIGGTWTYQDSENWNIGSPGLRNHAENIGWDSDNPAFEMVRYGLIAVGDNDFDGIIDGTGLPVSSAANINVGYENGKNCSSHCAAVLMKTDSKWILNGDVALAQPLNVHYNESAYYDMATHHSGAGFSTNNFTHSVELFNADTFFMVTSDIWKLERADASSDTDNNYGNSVGANLILDDLGKFSFCSTNDTISNGQLEHWSSTDNDAAGVDILKDRVHMFKAADKHHLSVGDSICYSRQNVQMGWNSVFGQSGYMQNQNYGAPAPVVGIIDDYHFLVNVTHGGNGDGQGTYGKASTYKDTSGSHIGVLVDGIAWKIGTEYRKDTNIANGHSWDWFGGRYSVDDYHVEGGGMRFYSDSNIIGAFAYDYPLDNAYCRPYGINSYNTSLLSWVHGRMIRPLGDKDVTGVSNFNLDNSISLSMPTLPGPVWGLVQYNTPSGSSYNSTSEPLSYPCQSKLFMSQKDGEDTKVYTFDWANIMPDMNNTTFDGVDYANTDGKELTTHRVWGSYSLGKQRAEFTDNYEDTCENQHMHNTVAHHKSAKGRMRLVGPRDTQASNTGQDGSGNQQNFMVPGGFMIRPGLNYFDKAYDDDSNTTFINDEDASGLLYPGHPNGMKHDTTYTGADGLGSLFSQYLGRVSPYARKGGLNDLVAIWSFNAVRHTRNDADDTVNQDFRYKWIYGAGRSFARKICSSYSTTGYNSSGTTGLYGADNNIYTNDAPSDTLTHIGNAWTPPVFSNTGSKVFARVHYPLPMTPATEKGNGQEVTFIKSRDAALAPVRLDLEVMPPYIGADGPGELPRVQVEGESDGKLRIEFLKPHSGQWDKAYNWAHNSSHTGARSYIDAGDTIKITGTVSYNGTYIIGSSSDNEFRWRTNAGAVTSTTSEYGKYDIVDSSSQANPLVIKDIGGLTISAYSSNGGSITFQTDDAFYSGGQLVAQGGLAKWQNFLFGVSKSGKFKIGKLLQAHHDSIMGWAFLDSDNLHDWHRASSYCEWGMTQSNDDHTEGFLSSNRVSVDNFLFATEASWFVNPATSLNSGSAHFTHFGDYKYKLSFVYDGYQEGPLSDSSLPITDVILEGDFYDSMDIAVTIINPNQRLTGVCLYRKNNVNDLYRLVEEKTTDTANWSEVSGVFTAVFRDDGGLEATFESRAGYSEFLKSPFVKYGMGTSMSGYHFVGDCSHPEVTDASHMIFRSLPGQFDLFNWANDFASLPTKPAAMANFAGRLYVFDETHTYRINPQTLVIEDTFDGSGCIGMKSLIITDFGMFYCDKNNAYMHNGSSPQIISHSIKKGGGSDISGFSITDFSWEKTAGAPSTMDPIVSFDNKRNAVLFFVEKGGDETVNHSRYYCWSFSILLQRWDLWEVSTGGDGSGTFDASKVIKPSSVITTIKGKNFVTQGDYLLDYLGGVEKKPWEFLTKKLTVGHQSQKKVWKNIQLIGNDDDVTTQTGDPKGVIAIAVDDNVIGGSDKTFTKDSPDGKVNIKGTSKTGRYLQFLLTKMSDSVDAMGVVFRRKSIK